MLIGYALSQGVSLLFQPGAIIPVTDNQVSASSYESGPGLAEDDPAKKLIDATGKLTRETIVRTREGDRTGLLRIFAETFVRLWDNMERETGKALLGQAAPAFRDSLEDAKLQKSIDQSVRQVSGMMVDAGRMVAGLGDLAPGGGSASTTKKSGESQEQGSNPVTPGQSVEIPLIPQSHEGQDQLRLEDLPNADVTIEVKKYRR